jgi:hypothetical protein
LNQNLVGSIYGKSSVAMSHRNKNCLWQSCLLMDRDENEHSL